MLSKLLRKIEPTLVRFYRQFSNPMEPNLRGDRDIEYSWIAGHLPQGPGLALEFGCGQSYLGLMAIRRGFSVTAIDLTPVDWLYAHQNLRFHQGDLFEMRLSPSSVDLIINCSTVEHVGLERYGGHVDPEGDLRAMQLMRSLLKPSGVMLLTIPVGKDGVFPPLHRVYGPARLPRLLSSFAVQRKEYWIKNRANRWVQTEEDIALSQQAGAHIYGLGCFVLQLPNGPNRMA